MVNGSHSTKAKNFSFSSSLDLDVACSSSLTQLAMVLAATKVSCFKKAAGKIREKRRLTCGGLVMGKNATFENHCCQQVLSRKKGFRVYCKRFLLGAFASEAARQLTSFSG